MPSNTEEKHSLRHYHWFVVIAIMLLGVAMKVFLLATDRLPFNADEAVVGLMAIHIQNGELPMFFYGQAYMGSLDAMLVAGVFQLFGKSILAIRVIQIFLFCLTIITTYLLSLKLTGNIEAGLITTLLLAIPTVNFTLYTTISLGGYGEALVLGNIILLTTLWIVQKQRWQAFLILGILAGFGLWVNGLTLVFSIPSICLLLFRIINNRKSTDSDSYKCGIFLVIIGGVLGAMPWWIYGTQNGFDSLVAELFGGAIAQSQVGFLNGLGHRFVSFILFGTSVIFGLRPPWAVNWLVLPLIPLILTLWAFVLIGFWKIARGKKEIHDCGFLLWGVVITNIAGFILTSFGNDPSGRYFLPMYISLAIMAGIFLTSLQARKKTWRWFLLAVLIVYNLGGILQCWIKTPPGFTTQFDASTIYDHKYDAELLEFLTANSITRGYTTYWLAYPLAFLSDEKIIFTPRLPYHDDYRYTSRDDRYPTYDLLVEQSDRIAYLTAHQPWLDQYLQNQFDNHFVGYEIKQIGDFTVYYELSKTITPDQMGLTDHN